MKLIENLNNSTLIEFLNKKLDFIQKKLLFLSENSFFIQNIDKIITFLAYSVLIASTFLDSEKLGLIIIGAFTLLILKFITKPNSKIEIDKFDFLVFLYVLFFCLATLFSSWFFDSLHGLIKVFTYFFSYIVFKNSIKQNAALRLWYLVLLAVLCTSQSLIGLQQQIFGVEALAGWQDMNNIDPTHAMTRVFGTLQPLNPNLMAGYLIAAMPTILGCAFYNFRKITFNIIALLALFATFLTIIFTGCRGSYVAITAQMLAFIALSGHIIWHDFKDKKYLRQIWISSILAGFLGILALVFSQEALQSRICSIFAKRDDSSNSFRFNVYQSSLQMLKDNPLCGIGVGNWTFREVYGLYMRTGFDALGAYSVPLEIAVETGILGLINFVVFISTTLISTGKKICSNISYNEKIILSATLISIIGMMIHGIVDTVWFRPQIQFVFWLMIAILSTSKNEEN
ncbi:MAG: O-antigen ligase family protein [bacterium]